MANKLFGHIAVDKGFMSRQQADQCAAIQTRFSPDETFGEIACKLGYLTGEQVGAVLWHQKAEQAHEEEISRELRLGALAVKTDLLQRADLYRVLRRQARMDRAGQHFMLPELLVKLKLLTPQQVEKLLHDLLPEQDSSISLQSLQLFLEDTQIGRLVTCPACDSRVFVKEEEERQSAPVLCLLCGHPLSGSLDELIGESRLEAASVSRSVPVSRPSYGEPVDPPKAVFLLRRDPASLVRKILGPYYIEELVSASNTYVFRSLHMTMERTVALKLTVPPDGPDNVELMARFIREARSAGQIDDRHVVRIYNVGNFGSILYLEIEYVDGWNGETWLEMEQPPLPNRVAVMADVLKGLARIHDAGIVHRDLKPANILIDQQEGRARISDFGLAKSDAEGDVTMPGDLVGTPFAMAPEVCMGRSATPLSDLYSAGVTFFFLLTGQRPFVGEDVFALFRQHLEAEPPSIRKLNPEVPHRLAAFVDVLLAKNPGSRFSGALAALDTLNTIRQQVEVL